MSFVKRFFPPTPPALPSSNAFNSDLKQVLHLANADFFGARPPGSLVQSLELTGLQAHSLAHGMRRGNDDDNDIDMSSIMRWVTLGTLRLNENY